MADIIQIDSFGQIDPHEWDDLAKGDVAASYGWLRLVEETSRTPMICRCLLARENSKANAAIFLWRQQRHDNQINMDYVLFGRLARMTDLLGLTALPAFVACQVPGWRHSILFRNSLPGDDRRRLLAQMLSLIEETTRGEGHSLCFRGIPPDDADLVDLFSARRYLCSPELPVCYLDITWESFNEYLRMLRKQHPATEKCIHREISQTRRAGVTIQRLEDPASVCSRLHAVLDSHNRRLNGMPFPFRPEFFEQLKARLGDKAIVYTAVKNQLIIGVQVMLCSEGNASFPIFGIDSEHSRKDSLYFNMAFNRPIRDAIEAGLQRIYFGRLVYDTKLRRGCRLANTNIYLRAKGGLNELLLRPLLACRSWKVREARNSLLCKAPE